MFPLPKLNWAVMSHVCCRVPSVIQVILQLRSSSAASKEIRIDTRSQRREERGNTSVGHELVWLALATQRQAYLGCFLCLTIVTARSVPTTENVRRVGKCQYLNIAAQICYHQLFAVSGSQSQNTFALISISCSSVEI